jgi:colicin import membrane protein
MVTIGSKAIDISPYSQHNASQEPLLVIIPIRNKAGTTSKLKVTISTTEVGRSDGTDDDGSDAASVLTGISGLSDPQTSMTEQDLSGFNESTSAATAKAAVAMAAVKKVSAPAAPDSVGIPSSGLASSPLVAAGASSTAASLPTNDLSLLKKELQDRGSKISTLERQLNDATRRLAAAGISDDENPSAGESDIIASLNAEVRTLRAELAEVAALQQQKDRHEARADKAETRIVELERELNKGSRPSSPVRGLSTSSEGGGTTGGDKDAEIATYKDQIAKLMKLVEDNGIKGPVSTDVEELSQRLAAAEEDAQEAENMAAEAIALLEESRQETKQAGAQLAQVRHDSEFAERKHAKERAEWELRLKDAFRKMEETIKLAETTQRERDEIVSAAQAQADATAARIVELQNETADLRMKLEPLKVDERIAAEVVKAKKEAQAQALIEVEALKKRIKEMEDYVEEADVGRFEAENKATAMARDLHSQEHGQVDSLAEVRAAEEQAEALALELKFLEAEKIRLEKELDAVRMSADRAAAMHLRDMQESTSQVGELSKKLSEARVDLQSALATESGLRAALAAATAAAVSVSNSSKSGSSGGLENGTTTNTATIAAANVNVNDASMHALNKEVADVRRELATVQTERDTALTQVKEVKRALSAQEAAVRELNDALAAQQAQRENMEKLHQAMALRASTTAAGGSQYYTQQQGGGEGGMSLSDMAATTNNQEAVKALEIQLQEAQSLADSSSAVAADMVQRLAETQSECQELQRTVDELREELTSMKSAPDGELRGRIQRLEREITVLRNRAEVNALFREEHDRVAGDLIDTKLAWAESQEEIVKLKRALVKSKEKSMSFASKLTKLETKFYTKLDKWKEKRRTSSSSSPEKSMVVI